MFFPFGRGHLVESTSEGFATDLTRHRELMCRCIKRSDALAVSVRWWPPCVVVKSADMGLMNR